MRGLKVNKMALWTGWVVSGGLVLASIFSAHVFYRLDYKYHALDAAFFAALDKLAWSAGVSWIIFACATKNGGVLDRLLSSRFLVPFSRVTYSAYLVNGFVVLYNFGTTRVPMHTGELHMYQTGFSHLVTTYLIALVMTLTFESPLNAIVKILATGRRKPVKEETKSDGIS